MTWSLVESFNTEHVYQPSWPGVLGCRMRHWQAEITMVTHERWCFSHIMNWAMEVESFDGRGRAVMLAAPYHWLAASLWSGAVAKGHPERRDAAYQDIKRHGAATLLCDDLGLITPALRRIVTHCYQTMDYGAVADHAALHNVINAAVAEQRRQING